MIFFIFSTRQQGKNGFLPENFRAKALAKSFTESRNLLDVAFNKPPNTSYERYKLLNRNKNWPAVIWTVLERGNRPS